MGGRGSSAAASTILVAEVRGCGPLLVLCWLCCWPDPDNSEASSNGAPSEYVIAEVTSTRNLGDIASKSRKANSSAVSLHLPTTQDHAKKALSAHHSHEEIRDSHRRLSHLETLCRAEQARYHSAPSVIHEVLHRRDWESSNKHLHRPGCSTDDERDFDTTVYEIKLHGSTPDNDRALTNLGPNVIEEVLHRRDWDTSTKDLYRPGRSSDEYYDSSSDICEIKLHDTDLVIDTHKNSKGEHKNKRCKKHYTNIKTSSKKEVTNAIEDDTDSNDNDTENTSSTTSNQIKRNNSKKTKQTINESIRTTARKYSFQLNDSDERLMSGSVPFGADSSKAEDIDDRSGAIHHTMDSRASINDCISRLINMPPPSVEPVGYGGGACYLQQNGCSACYLEGAGGERCGCGGRARVCSDGDILAGAGGAAGRPESGAFSESDVEWELNNMYEKLSEPHQQPRRETAI